eukprot:4050-Heterococcus_DN1.PRE.1
MASEGWTFLPGAFSSSPAGYIKPGGSSTVSTDICRIREDAMQYRQQLKAAAAAAGSSTGSAKDTNSAADDSCSDGEEIDNSSSNSSSSGGSFTSFESLQRPPVPIASALFSGSQQQQQQRNSGSGSGSSSSSAMAAPTPHTKPVSSTAGDVTADKAAVEDLLRPAETPLHTAPYAGSCYTGTPLDKGDHVRGDVSADVHSDGEHSTNMDTDEDNDADTAAAELTQLQEAAEAPGATFAEPVTEPGTEPNTEPTTEPVSAAASAATADDDDDASDNDDSANEFPSTQLQQPPTAAELLEQERQQLLAIHFSTADTDSKGWSKLSSKQGGWRCSANGLSGERYRKPGVASRAGTEGVDWFRTHTAAVAYAKSVLN